MTALWIALGGCMAVAAALCSPPLVRALSRALPAREPPEQPDGWRLGTVTVPFPDLDPWPAGAEATGRLVRVKALPSGKCVFTSRHRWIVSDLGLPAYVVDGSINKTPDGVTVSVFVPLEGVALFGFACTLLLAVSAGSLLVTPSLGAVVFVALVAWFGYGAWRSAIRGVGLLASDAIMALEQIKATRREPNRVDEPPEANKGPTGGDM